MNIKTIITVATLTAAFFLLYHEAIAHMLGRWNTLGSSHVPLILAVSLYLIWIKKDDIWNSEINPAIFSGATLLAAGCFILFAGKISGTILVQQISMVPFLLGITLLLAGYSWFKLLFLPIGYLIFMTGLVEQLLGSFAIHLQLITAWISAQSLKILGFAVFHNHIYIIMPHISLEVVRACSGINQMVTLMALAVPLAFMTRMTAARKIILVLSALFIGLFINGIRVTMIGVYALYKEGVDLHGPYETLSASVIFFAGLVVLIIFSRILSSRGNKKAFTNEDMTLQDSNASLPPGENSLNNKRLTSIFTAGIIIACTLGLIYFHNLEPVELHRPLDHFPRHIAGFIGEDLNGMSEQVRPFPADSELMRVYADEKGNSLELYIGYFELQDRGKKIIDYRRAWMHEQASIVPLAEVKTAPRINKTSLLGKSSNSAVYFWYQMDRRIIRNEYAGKFFTFMNAFIKRKNNAAVIVIRTKSTENQVMPFLEEAVPLIRTHLSEGKIE